MAAQFLELDSLKRRTIHEKHREELPSEQIWYHVKTSAGGVCIEYWFHDWSDIDAWSECGVSTTYLLFVEPLARVIGFGILLVALFVRHPSPPT